MLAKKGVSFIDVFSSSSDVRLGFWMLPNFQILCTGSEKQYRTENNTEFRRRRSVFESILSRMSFFRPTLYVAQVRVKSERWETRCTGTASRSSSGSSSKRSWVASWPHCCRETRRARPDCCLVAGEMPRRRPSATSAGFLHCATPTRTPSSETAAHCHPPVTYNINVTIKQSINQREICRAPLYYSSRSAMQ